MVVTNLHCLFDKVPRSQYMIKFLARVPMLNRPKIISSLAIFTEVVQLLFTNGSCRIEIFFSVTHFVLLQEIVCLLWPLPNEELWISRVYEVCAAATMEPGGHRAGIFPLAFSLQEMIFPGMRRNL